MRIDVQNAILLLLCLVLLLSVFSLSALAAESDYTGWPISSGESAFLPGTSNVIHAVDAVEVYVCYVSEIINNQTKYVTYWFSETNQTMKYKFNNLNSILSAQFGLEPDTGVYAYRYGESTVAPNAYVYSSLEDAVDDLVSSPSVPISSLDYTLPPGNVAYIPIPSGLSESISYTLTTTYYMAFGNNDTSRINQVVTVMSSLPSSSNNTAPSSPKIPWTNNGNVNLLGISANKIYQSTIPTNLGGQYLVIVNPMTMPSEGGLIGGDTYTNGSINISVSAVSGSPHIYPMSESLTITPGDGLGSESSYSDSGYTYEIDPETGEIIWTDPDGGSSAPVAGGNNPMPSPNTIFDWLRNISQQFSDFLRGPVQAVQVVVSAIRDFMGSFTQLYQWLPSPVYSLITSALMIALTIGVIKIFV